METVTTRSIQSLEGEILMTKKLFRYGGIIASAILIVFGIASIGMGAAGHNTVRDNLKAEQIVGSADMTPTAIAAEAKQAKLTNVDLPTCSVAGEAIDTGAKARCFAQYMRIHALEGTGGQVYSEMARYIGKDGQPTNDEKAAAIDPKSGKPVDNGARNLWVTETALSTALNTSYFAENVALFSIVMGIALLLTGIGFLIVSINLLRPAERKEAASQPAAKPVTA
ncbi:MAG TPA: hypothetical protein VFT50_06120 [Baekduia sp.]|nr:hypothetical protein [Baekduia sp.]